MFGVRSLLARVVEVAEDVFADDDSHVHNGANGNGDSGQGDDVGLDAKELHADEADGAYELHGKVQFGDDVYALNSLVRFLLKSRIIK